MRSLFLIGFTLSCLAGFGQITQVKLVSPINAKANTYEKVEIGIRLPIGITDRISKLIYEEGKGLNPYDPDDIDVRVTFRNGTDSVVVPAFYMQKVTGNLVSNKWFTQEELYNWRVRFSTSLPGEWSAHPDIWIKGKKWAKASQSEDIVFEIKSSMRKGPIRRSNHSKVASRYLEYHDGSPFFAIGENLCWGGYGSLTPKTNTQHVKWIKELAANGGNFARISLVPWDLEFEWKELGVYDQQACHALDNVVEAMDQHGVQAIMFLEIHDQYRKGEDWKSDRWGLNPYSKLESVKTHLDFFRDSTAKAIYKKKLRYFMARWGYANSTSIVELLSEVNNALVNYNHWDKEGKMERQLFEDWFLEMKAFIGKDKLVSASFASREWDKPQKKIYPHADLSFLHNYGQNESQNYVNRSRAVRSMMNNGSIKHKPMLIEEMGGSNGPKIPARPDSCTALSFHNSVWSSCFMGSFGTGLNWWWDYAIHNHGLVKTFKPVQIFFSDEEMNTEGYLPEQTRNKEIEHFFLVSSDRASIIGWIHNRTAYWYNEREQNQCISSWLAMDKGCYPKDAKKLPDKFIPFTGKVKLKGMKAGGLIKRNTYQLKWFNTRTGKYIKTIRAKVNASGNLKVKVPALEGINNGDIAYKLTYFVE